MKNLKTNMENKHTEGNKMRSKIIYLLAAAVFCGCLSPPVNRP